MLRRLPHVSREADLAPARPLVVRCSNIHRELPSIQQTLRWSATDGAISYIRCIQHRSEVTRTPQTTIGPVGEQETAESLGDDPLCVHFSANCRAKVLVEFPVAPHISRL